MGYIVATVSQKGGVGKSTLCRMIAREAAINGLTGKIADFDVRQSTTTRWTERRMQNGVEPTIRAETFLSVSEALKDAAGFDVFILDGAPQASKQTKAMADAAICSSSPPAIPSKIENRLSSWPTISMATGYTRPKSRLLCAESEAATPNWPKRGPTSAKHHTSCSTAKCQSETASKLAQRRPCADRVPL